MWVEAIQLRERGRKLSQEQLEAKIAQVGRLWVTTMRGWADDGERRPLTANLLGMRGSEVVVWRQLDKARVKVRDGQVMVLGWEDHGISAKSPRPVPQVWWCCPIHAPLDEHEARAAAKFPPNIGKRKRAAQAAADGRPRPAPTPQAETS